jgi:hypothetical protein
MSSKISFGGYGIAFAATAAILGVSALVVSTLSRAQTAPAGGTTAIQRDSDEARKLPEPSFQTREERLRAKPLDWNSTIGTPKPRVLTDEERKLLERARPEAAEGGAPDPKAELEARRLHPDDWK